MPYTVVQFAHQFLVGDTQHRETWPMQALSQLPDFRVIQVQYLSPCRYALALKADLLVLAVFVEPELTPILRWRKAKGKPTVVDVQNHLFAAEPWAPTFEERSLIKWQAVVLKLLSLADLLQTTTPFLAEEFGRYCPRVAVFPNQLPEEMRPHRLPERPDKPLVVGWGGSPSHFLDLIRVAPALSKWILERDDVVLWLMGDKGTGDFFVLPPEKKRFVPWGYMKDYARFLEGVHIGIAPMGDTPFNRARFDVKWLEYAAHGCVFVGQRMEVYSAVEDGRTGFLFNDPAEMVRMLDRLYRDRALMKRVRQEAFDHVTRHRRYEDHIRERAEVYRELLDRKSRETRDGELWTLHQQVHLPEVKLPDPSSRETRDYMAICPRPDEEKPLHALYFRDTDISEETVRFVEERYGEFHLTCYARGMLAAREGNLQAADEHLRRSLWFYPAAVESMVLHGKVLHAMGRQDEARRALSSAVQWHDAYVPAHVALVKALTEVGDHEAAIAAAEEWEAHCCQDPTALARKGAALIRSGRREEGMVTLREAMDRCERSLEFWQRPHAAELVQVLRELDGIMARDERWEGLIVETAERFLYSLWLAARAGAICLRRGDPKRGAKILQAARERLFEAEWQALEGGAERKPYRIAIELYRMACEELARG